LKIWANLITTIFLFNENLSDVIRDFKKYTSGNLIKRIECDGDNNKWMLEIFNEGGEKQNKKTRRQVRQYNKKRQCLK
jgi:hypothetical protein